MRKILLSFSLWVILSGLNGNVLAAPDAKTVETDTAHFYMRHSYDVLKYTLSFDLYNCYSTPYSKYFQAKENILFRVDSTLDRIFLNAVASSMVIDSVGLSASSFTTSGDTLWIQLNRTYNPGETTEIRICYHHLNVNDHAFYASSGTVFTDFPPEGARKVFPCWDRPADKALTDITVKVPANVRLGSTGILSDSVVSADTIRYHWVNHDPVSTYLITLTSKNVFQINRFYYHLWSDPSDSIEVRLYYKLNEVITTAQQLIKPVTDFYSQKFGDYPFEKIGFATLTGAFPWGGMENQTMVNLMPGGYSDATVMSHEHSHMWFGDLITCGTWADIWLNEGFATFCESLWTEQTEGYSAYVTKIKGMAGVYFAQNPGLPIYNPSWAIHTPLSGLLYSTPLIYNKGCCVLYQLRHLLGDSVFFNVMHAYCADTNFRFKNAVTEDFVAKVNEITGQDYQWYFDEWVYHRNHPAYDNRYEITDEGSNTWNFKFRITQIQAGTCFFRMPVDITVNFEGSGDTTLTLLNDENDQVFEFTFNKKPVGVTFDKDDKIVLKEATTILGIPENKNQDSFTLYQNHPNPFGTSTVIEYSLAVPSKVTLTLLNAEGKIVKTLVNADQTAGRHAVDVQMTGLSYGVYYYRLQAGRFESTRKMIFLK